MIIIADTDYTKFSVGMLVNIFTCILNKTRHCLEQ